MKFLKNEKEEYLKMPGNCIYYGIEGKYFLKYIKTWCCEER